MEKIQVPLMSWQREHLFRYTLFLANLANLANPLGTAPFYIPQSLMILHFLILDFVKLGALLCMLAVR
ncbi:hypothetical protein COLO4_32119 [Corchorus olitorius]|uniref:Uncharacterized protein n=1 Tax=Corchorus olitorius TaxID=93759 RepID=A0A1R3H169_9ROSI|nr:hypothetical protein COLO4_32119 [Corchorus olitorius]